MKKIIIIGLSLMFFGSMTANAIKLPGMPGKSDDKAASAEASESAADSECSGLTIQDHARLDTFCSKVPIRRLRSSGSGRRVGY